MNYVTVTVHCVLLPSGEINDNTKQTSTHQPTATADASGIRHTMKDNVIAPFLLLCVVTVS